MPFFRYVLVNVPVDHILKSFISYKAPVLASLQLLLPISNPTISRNLCTIMDSDSSHNSSQDIVHGQAQIAPKTTEKTKPTSIPLSSPLKCSVITPPVRKQMTKLDRSAFEKEVAIPAILVGGEDKEMHFVFTVLKSYLLKIRNIKPVEKDEETGFKRALINPDLIPESNLDDFLASVKAKCSKPDMLKSIEMKNVQLTYENWSHEQLIDSILPDENDKVSGFSKIGHLIHLNLREHHFPYKNILGEILLDKVPNTRTVVNKLNIIDNTFRNFKMELLAGELNTVVTVKESKCDFEFDFAHVYWNPRLCTEHERIHGFLRRGDTLYDVFAGVGPFAVPVGKKRIRVLANDLNPESFRWLEHNVKKNKVGDFVKTFNQDGRDFIIGAVKQDLQASIIANKGSGKNTNTFHVTMNLPALAVDFLDAFWNILDNNGEKVEPFPKVMVHVYCFVKDAQDFKQEAVELVRKKLGFDLKEAEHIEEASFVRNVAPNKEMFRISFYLPHEVMIQNQCESEHLYQKISDDGDQVKSNGSLKRKLSDLDPDA